MKRILEIACFNPESAIIANNSGADRIELCDNYSEGGITPNADTIRFVRKKTSIKLFAMIRPRGGDFIYSTEEIKTMRAEILVCKEIGCDGIVFGILDRNNIVQEEICTELVTLAKPMESSFHRAFDQTANDFKALETIIRCGFTRILTSGNNKNAEAGIVRISELISVARGRILILPGGGIRSENVREIMNKTSANEFHSSAIKDFKNCIADASEIEKLKKQIED